MPTQLLAPARAATENRCGLGTAVYVWAFQNGWQRRDSAWLSPAGGFFFRRSPEALRQAMVCDMQDRDPGEFERLVEQYGDDVWRAVDGVPLTGEAG